MVNSSAICRVDMASYIGMVFWAQPESSKRIHATAKSEGFRAGVHGIGGAEPDLKRWVSENQHDKQHFCL